jgi:predicted transcriptional regulator
MLNGRAVLDLDEQLVQNECFMAEVEKGIRSAREEPLVDHEEVVRQIHAIIAKAQKENAAQMV